ncbi:MAG: 30S ribosomal protein S27ae [Nitrososphaeraceae archaeon]
MPNKDKSAASEVAIYKFYKIEGEKLTRVRRECPRCGRGVFMAEHKNRNTCGKCGFTEFRRSDESKKQTSKS